MKVRDVDGVLITAKSHHGFNLDGSAGTGCGIASLASNTDTDTNAESSPISTVNR
jgi:hypothetical protein